MFPGLTEVWILHIPPQGGHDEHISGYRTEGEAKAYIDECILQDGDDTYRGWTIEKFVLATPVAP